MARRRAASRATARGPRAGRRQAGGPIPPAGPRRRSPWAGGSWRLSIGPRSATESGRIPPEEADRPGAWRGRRRQARASPRPRLGLRAYVSDHLAERLEPLGRIRVRDPTRSDGLSVVCSSKVFWNSWNALRLPRTRLIGTISPPAMVRIGFTWSSSPAHACARPIRPPRARNSSVSTVNTSPNSCLNASTSPRSPRRSSPARAGAAQRARGARSRATPNRYRRPGFAHRSPPRAEPRALPRPRELRGQREHVDALVIAETLVGGREVARRRLRRRRHRGRLAEARVEVGGGQLDVVAELSSPKRT